MFFFLPWQSSKDRECRTPCSPEGGYSHPFLSMSLTPHRALNASETVLNHVLFHPCIMFSPVMLVVKSVGSGVWQILVVMSVGFQIWQVCLGSKPTHYVILGMFHKIHSPASVPPAVRCGRWCAWFGVLLWASTGMIPMKCILHCLALRVRLVSSWFSWIGLVLSGNFTEVFSKGPPVYFHVPRSYRSLKWSYSDKNSSTEHNTHCLVHLSFSSFSWNSFWSFSPSSSFPACLL